MANKDNEASTWFTKVEEVATLLERMGRQNSESEAKRLREDFYGGVWNLTESRARIVLGIFGWRGDITQEAKDIASEFHASVMGQEQRYQEDPDSKGVFAPRVYEERCKYLGGAIANSVRQAVWRRIKRCPPMVDIDDEEKCGELADTRQDNWVEGAQKVFRAIEKAAGTLNEKQRKALATVTPEALLELSLAKRDRNKAIDMLMPGHGLPLRTRQRYQKVFKQALKEQIEMDFL